MIARTYRSANVVNAATEPMRLQDFPESLKRFLTAHGMQEVTNHTSSSWSSTNTDSESRFSHPRAYTAFEHARRANVLVTLDRVWYSNVEVALWTLHNPMNVTYYDVYVHMGNPEGVGYGVIHWTNDLLDTNGVCKPDPFATPSIAEKAAKQLTYLRTRAALPLFTKEMDVNPGLADLHRLVTSFGCQRFERWRHVNAEQVYVEEIRDGARTISAISDSPTIDVFTFGALRVTIHDALCDRPDYSLELHVPSSSGEYEYVNVLEIPEGVDSLVTLNNPLKNADVFNATRQRIQSFNRRGLYFTT
jgi:hypothetical protein